MKAISLIRKIEALGGTAEVAVQSALGASPSRTFVSGLLNGHDVHMYELENTYFTVRSISKRGYYDAGSDYNSGGFDFCHKLKELEYYAQQVAA